MVASPSLLTWAPGAASLMQKGTQIHPLEFLPEQSQRPLMKDSEALALWEQVHGIKQAMVLHMIHHGEEQALAPYVTHTQNRCWLCYLISTLGVL